MSLEFVKYHGLGNDFLVCEGTDGSLEIDEIVELCRRHRGVGADGVLLVEPLVDETPPAVRMVIYNRDGSRPEMCGNGVRCVAAYGARYLKTDDQLVVRSDAGPRRCEISREKGHRWSVTVDMGRATSQTETTPLTVGDRRYDYIGVDVGNPHAVIFESPEVDLVERIGRLANDAHPAFPDGVNVELTRPGESKGYRAAVFERGVGRTRACGTGACAVAEAVWTTGRARRNEAIDVELPGGVLTIESRDDRVWMTGPAEEVFSGVWRP